MGGGPAGLSTALFLARLKPGLCGRIVVLEKEHYPREKYCAGAVGGRADRKLSGIGVRVDVPSVWVRGISASLGQKDICLRLDAGEIGRVVRRIEFDAELCRMARERGIAVVEGAAVTSLKMPAYPGDLCVAETRRGTVRARVIVGADGVGSVVRRSLGIPFGKLRAQVVEVDTEPKTQADEQRDLLHFDLRDRGLRGYSWDFPTLCGGQNLVCRGSYVLADAQGKLGADPYQVLKARLESMGLDIRRYPVKRFSERGFEPELGLCRPNALLVGEAAGIDPMLGEGIAQAIDYGALAGAYLAECIDKNNFQFSDWPARVCTSRLGRDLRIRKAVLAPFFGAQRDLIEDFLENQPPFFKLGLQYFGGHRISKPRLLQIMPRLIALAARIGISDLQQ